MVRILHFSDIHLRKPFRTIPFTDWLSKRTVGAMNLALGRADAFADAHQKVQALDRFRREQEVDLVVFTGDYSALGTEAELKAAREAVAPLLTSPAGYVHVPGNHDVYVSDVIRQRRFRRNFEHTFDTDLPEYRSDSTWPIVRLIGNEVAVVAVNSARPSFWPWISTGRIPRKQLDALERILADDRVRGRFVFVMTHYAPRRADGTPDHRLHRMVNAERFLEACAGIEAGAILCGHIHRRFHVSAPGRHPPIFCAGSTTKESAEGLWVFDVERKTRRATPGLWQGTGYALESDGAVDL